MARQEGECWRCGTRWASEEEPRIPLRVIVGGALTQAAADTDRWMNEGGSFDGEVATPLRAISVRA
jgi:hypothetical protein